MKKIICISNCIIRPPFPSRAFAVGWRFFHPTAGTLSRAFCGDSRTGFDLSSTSCPRNSWCTQTRRQCFCRHPIEPIATTSECRSYTR